MYVLYINSAFTCFKGVVVYLSCIWLFMVLYGFFKGCLFAYDNLATLESA